MREEVFVDSGDGRGITDSSHGGGLTGRTEIIGCCSFYGRILKYNPILVYLVARDLSPVLVRPCLHNNRPRVSILGPPVPVFGALVSQFRGLRKPVDGLDNYLKALRQNQTTAGV